MNVASTVLKKLSRRVLYTTRGALANEAVTSFVKRTT